MQLEIKKTKDLTDLIRQHNGNTEKIKEIVQVAVAGYPNSIFTVPAVVRYLTAEMQKNSALSVIGGKEQNWLRYVAQMREFLPDEDIRLAALSIYKQSPWFFYNHADVLKQIFPNEWFRKLIHEDTLDLRNSPLWEMFLLFNGHSLPESFSSPLDQYINEEIRNLEEENVDLMGIKEPGFACGGMEKNFLEAAKTGEGICLVNNLFHAKYYHRKGDPAKVTYLPKGTFKTLNGYIVWRDYFYSPSNGQHGATIEAIKAGTKEITIPDLCVKAVRPTIHLTSKTINEIMGK